MRSFMRGAAVGGALPAPSPALAQKVVVDSNPAAAFGSYHTYAWTTGTPAASPLAEQRVHALVDRPLAGTGFTKGGMNPDVVIATHVVTKEEKQLNVTDYGGFGWGYGYGFGGSRTASVETFTV